MQKHTECKYHYKIVIALASQVQRNSYNMLIFLQNTHKNHPYLTCEFEVWNDFYEFIVWSVFLSIIMLL